jgi:Holliday junction resolvase
MLFTETIPANSSWNSKIEVKKGNRGEQIVYEFLKKKGWIVYKAVTDGSHCFDFFFFIDRRELRVIEVKTKAKRNKYPDTGFALKHYEEYKRIMERHNLEIYIVFVDEGSGDIYGNFLRKLEEPKVLFINNKQMIYPNVCFDTIYFPVENMVTIAKLNEQDVDYLKTYSKRSYEYAS